MKKHYFFFLALTSIIIFSSCGDEKEDVTHEINKAAAIETSVSVEHLNDTLDVLITKHVVWNNNVEYKTIYNRDTIPGLSVMNTTAENSDGDTKRVDVKKDYEIFITVK